MQPRALLVARRGHAERQPLCRAAAHTVTAGPNPRRRSLLRAMVGDAAYLADDVVGAHIRNWTARFRGLSLTAGERAHPR
jgi:hypothetical protein